MITASIREHPASFDELHTTVCLGRQESHKVLFEFLLSKIDTPQLQHLDNGLRSIAPTIL